MKFKKPFLKFLICFVLKRVQSWDKLRNPEKVIFILRITVFESKQSNATIIQFNLYDNSAQLMSLFRVVRMISETEGHNNGDVKIS